MSYKLILFDADGTLFNDDDAIIRAFKKAFIKHGYRAPSEEVIIKHAGNSGFEWTKAIAKDERILAHLSDEKINEILHDADNMFNGFFFKVLGKEMTSARQLLEHLKKENIKTAIITNGTTRTVIDCIKTLKLDHLIAEDKVYAADQYQSKPNPEMILAAINTAGVLKEETLMVGDSQTDIDAANAAEIHSALLINSRNKDVTGETQRITSLNQLINI